FDVVVVDMQMNNPAGNPKEAGLVVLRLLQELPTRPLALVLTAHGSPPNTVKALGLGAAGYLHKDKSPDKLPELIRKALDFRQKSFDTAKLLRSVETARRIQ